MNVSILIPVYNEAGSIKCLIEQIADMDRNYSIVIVDDDSNDGTTEIVRKTQQDYNVRHYIRKAQRGYGSALIFGFRQITQADAIVTMDADFSHDPVMISSFLTDIENNCDVVIGSRYVEGGSIHSWPLVRRIMSKMVNWLVRVGLQTNIRDNTSGFRAYSGSAIQEIVEDLRSDGYCVLEEILYYARQRDLTCKEKPISFINRKEGASKARMPQEALRLLYLIWRLRTRKRSCVNSE